MRLIEFQWSEKLRLGNRRMIAFVKLDGCRFKT